MRVEARQQEDEAAETVPERGRQEVEPAETEGTSQRPTTDLNLTSFNLNVEVEGAEPQVIDAHTSGTVQSIISELQQLQDSDTRPLKLW